MAIGPIRPAQQQHQQEQQPLPLPHDDVEYIDQRFQASYYTPEGNWDFICINWNTRQHRAIIVMGNQNASYIEVERNFQITLREVLEVNNIIVHQIAMIDLQGNDIQDTNAIMNQSVEDMQLAQATIWSHGGPADVPIQPAIYQYVPEPVPEPIG